MKTRPNLLLRPYTTKRHWSLSWKTTKLTLDHSRTSSKIIQEHHLMIVNLFFFLLFVIDAYFYLCWYTDVYISTFHVQITSHVLRPEHLSPYWRWGTKAQKVWQVWGHLVTVCGTGKMPGIFKIIAHSFSHGTPALTQDVIIFLCLPHSFLSVNRSCVTTKMA